MAKRRITRIDGILDESLPARVQISLFNPLCTGQYLSKILQWIAKSEIQTIEIQIADSLQRFNYMWKRNLSEAKAEEKAQSEGDRWISLNSANIEFCHSNFDKITISNWNHWINNPGFREAREKYQNIYETDSRFAALVRTSIEDYLERSDNELNDRSLDNSVRFLLEEIAVSDIAESEEKSNEIYPGGLLLAEKYIKSNREYDDISNIKDINFISMHFSDP